VLQRGVALSSELCRLQLLPHQSAKRLVVRARSRRIRAGLWRHSTRSCSFANSFQSFNRFIWKQPMAQATENRLRLPRCEHPTTQKLKNSFGFQVLAL